jgi:pimeloyl-ACP methyl ester carboxylesterase
MIGCRSTPKPRVTERLLALEKNEPIRRAGVQETDLELSLDGTTHRLRLRYLFTAGADASPDALPVVFVHGTPGTLCTWVEPIFGGAGFAGLREGRDCYAIEVIGHGMAPGSADPYDFETCGRFVAAALEALRLPRVHLVGHSYGGEFAWRAALEAGARVRSLTLIDSAGWPRGEDGFLPEEVAMRESRFARFAWILSSHDRVRSALAPHFRELPPERVEELHIVCENAENWHAMVDLARDEPAEDPSRAALLRKVGVPTLLLWGAEDIAYPPESFGQAFADTLPSARLSLIEGAGHYPHEERPAEVVRALSAFFAEQDP